MMTPHERLVATEGMYNVRDLGGCPTSDGARVRRGKLFRGDDLHRATDRDLALFAAIPIQTVIDFRDAHEKRQAPDRLPPGKIRYVELPIEVGNILDVINLSGGREAADLMVEVNVSLARHSQAVFRDFFRLVAEAEHAPLFFHCSAGKDRTGFAAALLLSALGVARETVIADYRISGDYIRPKYLDYMGQNPDLAPMVESRVDYLNAAFAVIEAEFGGVARYLAEQLDVDVAALRALYLDHP